MRIFKGGKTLINVERLELDIVLPESFPGHPQDGA